MKIILQLTIIGLILWIDSIMAGCYLRQIRFASSEVCFSYRSYYYQEFRYRESISCNCPSGYYPPRRRISCGYNNRWSEMTLSCNRPRPVTCSRLYIGDSNVIITPDRNQYDVETIVSFSCRSGYDLVGCDRSRCCSTGQWTNTPPRCILRQQGCILTQAFAARLDQKHVCFNRQLIGSRFSEGCSAAMCCVAGYVPIKGCAPRATCRGGSWHLTSGCRVKQVTTCDTPRSTDSKLIMVPRRATYTVGSTVSFSCPPGFKLQGIVVVRCCCPGRWTDPAPCCRPVKRSYCPITKKRIALFAEYNFVHSFNAPGRAKEGVTHFVCKKGYWSCSPVGIACYDGDLTIIGDCKTSSNQKCG